MAESSSSSSTGSTGSHVEHAEDPLSDQGAGIMLLALAVGIFCRVWLGEWIKLPFTVLMLAFGCLMGAALLNSSARESVLQHSAEIWVGIDPKTLQIVFLPVLIFASAWNASFHFLERQLGRVLWLAVPGVVLGSVLTATFVKLILPYDWPWNISLVFGSIVSATDPVAVVALLGELGVSEKIGTLIEGESLFNDGSAIVVFEVFLESSLGVSRNWSEVLGFACRLALGGPALGILFAFAGVAALGYIVNDTAAEIVLTVVLAYGTFVVAETTRVKVSGVLAVCIMGLLLSHFGRSRISPGARSMLDQFWVILDFIANTLIFFASGLIVVGQALLEDRAIDSADWGYLFALYLWLTLVRVLLLALSWPILHTGPETYQISWQACAVMVHGGLRGAVALILALIVDGEESIDSEIRDKIIFLTSGIAVMTLVINGSTTKFLVEYLELDHVSHAQEEVFDQATYALEIKLQQDVQELKKDPFLADADWACAWRYIPVFSTQSLWHRVAQKNILLSEVELEDTRFYSEQNVQGGAPSALASASAAPGKMSSRYSFLPPKLRRRWQLLWRRFPFEANVEGEKDLDSFYQKIGFEGMDGTSEWTGKRLLGVEYFGSKQEDTPSPTAGMRMPAVSEGGEMEEEGAGDEEEKEHELHENHSRASEFASRDMSHQASSSISKLFSSSSEPKGNVSATSALILDPVPPPNGDSHHTSPAAAKIPRTSHWFWSLRGRVVHKGAVHLPKSEELVEARLRVLAALKAQFLCQFNFGALVGDAHVILNDSIVNAEDLVEEGYPLDTWHSLAFLESPKRMGKTAELLKWGSFRALASRWIAFRLLFSLTVTWSHLRAYKQLNLEGLFSKDEQEQAALLSVQAEIGEQMALSEAHMEEMIGTVPFIARSVMTRCAARMMIFQYLRNAELWHEEGHLLESEIDEIRHSVKETLIDLADHPAQESPPDLKEEARHIECLFYLNSGDIARVVESGAVKEESYYGDSKIITRGEHAAANGKNSWFFLTRGTVRRTVLRPDNSEAHSLHHRGMLFGIGDEMLNRPHHASYSSSTFCTLISFDADMLKSLSNDIPALRRGLWNSVGAHALRHCALVRPDSHFASMTLKLLHEILEASAMHLLPKVEEQAAEGAEPERRTLSIPSGGVMLLLSAKAIDLKVPGGGSARASHLGHGMASTVTSPGSAVAELELPLMITNDGASPIAVTLEALAAEAAGESVAFVIPPHAIAQASSTEKATCSVIEHRKRLSTDLRMASTSALLGQDGRRSISRRALSVSSMGPRGSSAPVRRPTQLRRRLSIRTSSDRR